VKCWFSRVPHIIPSVKRFPVLYLKWSVLLIYLAVYF